MSLMRPVALLALTFVAGLLHACGASEGTPTTGISLEAGTPDANLALLPESAGAQDVVASIQSTFLLREPPDQPSKPPTAAHVPPASSTPTTGAATTAVPLPALSATQALAPSTPSVPAPNPVPALPPTAVAASPATAGTIPIVGKPGGEGFQLGPNGITPILHDAKHRLSVQLPSRANDWLHVTEPSSSTAVSVRLQGASDVAASAGKGHLVFVDGYGAGRHVVHRVGPDVAEDYVVFPSAPSVAELVYEIHLDAGVQGLRLVS